MMSSSIGDAINELSLELSKVQGEIERVEGEIERVATKIENEEHLSPDEKSDWKEKLLMEEKKLLREKEKQLREEKKLLMQKEMQLRDEEKQSLRKLELQQQQQHKNFAEGVFVLYRGDDGDAEPIGTAFSISGNLLLTACHNVVFKSTDGKTDSMVVDLKITAAMIKAKDGKIAAELPSRRVSVHSYNIAVDWASLMLQDESPVLPFKIPIATAPSDMPAPATLEKLHIYHCPVQLFLDDPEIERCHVMQKEASVGVIMSKTLTYQNGGFPGSCGGPYIFRNKAVALHTESVSTTKTAEDIKAEASASGRKRKLQETEVTRMMVDSCVSNHSSLGSGILLHVRSGIMNLLDE